MFMLNVNLIHTFMYANQCIFLQTTWLEKIAETKGQFSAEEFGSSSTSKDNVSIGQLERSISHPSPPTQSSTSSSSSRSHAALQNHHSKSNSVDSVYI